MRLYILERVGVMPEYGATHSVVLRAKSPKDARRLAADRFGKEEGGPDVWMNELKSNCEHVGPDGPRCVVFADFRPECETVVDGIVGRSAFLRDIHSRPKETGACTIIARSDRGPNHVIVEWQEEHYYHSKGDVSVVPLSWLDLR